MERWPAHPLVWSARYAHLIYSGRPGAAAAFVQDPDALPSGFGPQQIAPRITLARAIQSRRPSDIESSIEWQRRIALAEPQSIRGAAPIFALLGRIDLTFASLERYYLDRGSFGERAPIGALTRRYTDFLFSPPMAAVRRDPRFAGLTRAIGLDDYWRATGSRPAHLLT